jgi:predicted DNA repair protein MutK
VSHLDVDPNMFQQATHEQLGLLAGVEVVVGVGEHGVIALRVLLDRRGERQAGKFRKARPMGRRPEL